MDRQEILRRLEAQRERWATFGVRRLALFGSAARDEIREGSDVDVLVEFDAPATLAQYMGLKFFLEELLGRAVDLVTEKGLRRELRPQVEREAVRVA
jgi:predicted nucleotidyltransferase